VTESSDPAVRPDWACLTHLPPTGTAPWRQAHEGYRTCDNCLDLIRGRLTEIAKRYGRLDPSPGASGDGSRGAPGFGSRPPASDHVIVMTDPRSSSVARVWRGADGRLHRESERPPLSVFGVLDTLAWEVAEARGFDGGHGQRDVAGLCRWLDNQLDWITREEMVVELDVALRRLVAQLRPVTGDPRRPIGSCPNTIDDGEHTRECGTRLYAPLLGDTVACRACGRQWRSDEWMHLGDLLDAG